VPEIKTCLPVRTRLHTLKGVPWKSAHFRSKKLDFFGQDKQHPTLMVVLGLTVLNTYILFAGWWFGTFGLFFHILGISSSQLTFIFFRGIDKPPTSSPYSQVDLPIKNGDFPYLC